MLFRELLDLHGAGWFVNQYENVHFRVMPLMCSQYKSLQTDRQLDE